MAPAENQAIYDTYLKGWADLNHAIRRGEPWSGGERNAAFVNMGRGADFVDAAPLIGLDHADDGRAAATFDADFDGYEDLLVTARTEPRVRVLRNGVAGNSPSDTLVLTVKAKAAGADSAVGAVVYATPLGDGEEAAEAPALVPGVTQRRSRTAGAGYLAQSSAWLRFAFPRPKDAAPDLRRRVRLSVRWPRTGGQVEDFGVVTLRDKRIQLLQGAGRAREVATPEPIELLPRELLPFGLSGDSGRRLALPAPSSIPGISVQGASGRFTQIFGLTPDGPRSAGNPVVAIVWDSDDPNGVVQLGAVGALCEEAKAGGALVVSIDLASGGTAADITRGATLLKAAGFDGDELLGIGSAPGVLGELVAWRLDRPDPPPLPWSFVTGADGRLDVIRTGAWSEGDLASDLLFCQASGAARLLLASPFGGRWIDPPLEINLARLRSRLEKAGLSGAVLELDRARLTAAKPTDAEVQIQLGRAALGREDYATALSAFDAALKDDAKSVLAHRARAYTLHLLERFGEAESAWKTALALDPNDAPTRVNRSLAAIEAGHPEVAEADLEVLEATRGAGSEEAQSVRRALAER